MKIAILGAGRVGTAVAFSLILRNLARDIVLVSRDLKKAEGEAADLHHAAALLGGARVHACTIDDAKYCDIVVLAASAPETQNSDRLSHLAANSAICIDLIPR